jgi:hypothetical protein
VCENERGKLIEIELKIKCKNSVQNEYVLEIDDTLSN